MFLETIFKNKESATLTIAILGFCISLVSLYFSWNTHKINRARFDREKEDREDDRLPRLVLSSVIQNNGSEARLYCNFKNQDYGQILIQSAALIEPRDVLLALGEFDDRGVPGTLVAVNPIGRKVEISEWLDEKQPKRIMLMIIALKGSKLVPGMEVELEFRMAFEHKSDQKLSIKRSVTL